MNHSPRPGQEDQISQVPDGGQLTIWILDCGNTGDNQQMRALAATINGARTQEICVRAKSGKLPKWPSLPWAGIGWLARETSAQLRPPWPDFVFFAGRSAPRLALHIRRQSGGRTQVIAFGRPRMPYHYFDLVISSAPFHPPARSNVLVLSGPLHLVDEQVLQSARGLWHGKIARLPSPRIAVLAGGKSPPYRFGPDEARRLGQAASQLARRCNGSLLVTTVRRTPTKSVQALKDALDGPFEFFEWGQKGENPYFGYLAMADMIIVTVDSLSMMAEAASCGVPMLLFQLQKQDTFWRRLLEKLLSVSQARPDGVLASVLASFHERGFFLPRADRQLFAEELVTVGKANWISAKGDLPRRDKNNFAEIVKSDLNIAAKRVLELLPGEPEGGRSP